MEKTTTTPHPPVALIKPARLASIDALRGFDMLMIAGGGQFLALLGGKTGLSWVDAVAAQFEHPAWHGFAFYDFIFPLFLFLAGTSLPFSLSSGLAKGISKGDLLRKVGKRMLILICLGILYKNAPLDLFDPAHIRYGSVLGRIGIATFVGAALYLYSSPRQTAIRRFGHSDSVLSGLCAHSGTRLRGGRFSALRGIWRAGLTGHSCPVVCCKKPTTSWLCSPNYRPLAWLFSASLPEKRYWATELPQIKSNDC